MMVIVPIQEFLLLHNGQIYSQTRLEHILPLRRPKMASPKNDYSNHSRYLWQVSLNSGWFCITILILNRFLPYLVGSPEPASLLSVEHVSAKSTIDRLSGIHDMVFHI